MPDFFRARLSRTLSVRCKMDSSQRRLMPMRTATTRRTKTGTWAQCPAQRRSQPSLWQAHQVRCVLLLLTLLFILCWTARGYPSTVAALTDHVGQPGLAEALRRYLFEITYPHLEVPDELDELPIFAHRISVFHSAIARFYAPSDTCGTGGMYRERIRSTPSWQKKYDRRDTVFVITDADAPGMQGMLIARVLMFLSFVHNGVRFPCALVRWLLPERIDEDTGHHVVRWEEIDGQRPVQVIGLDAVARGAHLLPVYGSHPLPEHFHYSDALNAFSTFYVNRHADHHTHEFI